MERVKIAIYRKEFFRYRYVWVLFFLAIIVSFWLNIPALYIQCFFPEEVCKAICNIISSISLSYVAGFIFFLLSEFIPAVKNKCEEMEQITYYLNNLIKDYYGLMNFTDDADNYQRMPFAELSQSLFQEDVSQYCDNINLSIDNGEGDIDVHFKPEIMFYLELNANSIREDINILQMVLFKQPVQAIEILGKIKCCRFLSEIEKRKGFRADFDLKDLKIRLVLYKEMMREYYFFEEELMNLANEYNKYFPQYRIWRTRT